MNYQDRKEKSISLIIQGTILAIFFIYISQGFIYHLRFSFIDAKKIKPELIDEQCDERNCKGTFSIDPTEKFLLLGHILRSHQLLDAITKEEILPISVIRDVSTETWINTRVYQVDPSRNYIVIGTKPKAVKMDYFIGILPRSTDHPGMLSIPSISQTIGWFVLGIGFSLLSILMLAAYASPSSSLVSVKNKTGFLSLTISMVGVFLASVINTGVANSLFPDNELRSQIIRTGTLVAILGFPITGVFLRIVKNEIIANLIFVVILILFVNLLWEQFRSGIPYIAAYTTSLLILLYSMIRRRHLLAATLVSFSFYDVFFMTGVWSIPDVPPMYLYQVALIGSFGLIFKDYGAVTLLGYAAKAYYRFIRDVKVGKISNILRIQNGEIHGISLSVQQILPSIAHISDAGRVSVLINFPFSRPIMHSYSEKNNITKTYDDGRIPGAVTIRSFVYGDEYLFETYRTFSEKFGLPYSPLLKEAEYICVIPIKVNKENVGVIMLTCFDDHQIRKKIASGEIEDLKTTILQVVQTISNAFSATVIENLENNASLAKELLTNMRNALPFCNTVEEFIHIYADSIYQVTGLRTLIHQWVGSSAIAIAHSGLDENHWEIFKNNPFNLASNAKNAMGPTVVAFRESKSSYLKDWNEISDRFHPKTISILSKIETKSLIAVPVKSGSDTFVITLLSRMDETPKDPGINRVIEATEAIFDAAITVLKQKSSILALGNISNRLIGDNEVRQQILAAARQSELPTIIGSPRSSLILLIDLVGSSYLPVDSLSKAKSYGVFYDEVNATVGKKIGGKVRKTIGDAVVITWDNSQFDPRDQLRFFENLMEVLDLANATAKRVGCDGVRSVLHFGHYFFGLIGTSSFGQIDVIGLGIDEVCKLETKIKTVEIRGEAISIALSPNAVEYLGYQSQSKLEKLGFSLIALGPNSTESIWCCNKRKQLSTDVA